MVDLGKKPSDGKKPKNPSILEITDIELLHKMYKQTISRGKRQRIKKRIALLENPNAPE